MKERAEYFRSKPVKINGLFLVKDYFKSGELQMLALYSIDEDVFVGEVKWYYKSGEIKKKRLYDKIQPPNKLLV